MAEHDAPAWAIPLIQDIGEIKGTLTALNGTFAQHMADDKLTAGKVEVIEKQMLAAAAASGVKAKLFAGVTHAVTSGMGAGVTILLKKLGVW